MLYIPVILGTARKGRNSENVAKYLVKQVKQAKIKSEIIDVRDYHVHATDNSEKSATAKRLAKKVTKADAFIIVSPEYNHGYPGELKLMLDLLYSQFNRKPVGICGVSNGGMGGARCVEQLKLVALTLGMVALRDSLYFPLVNDLFDKKGNIKDEKSHNERFKKFFKELTWYAKALKRARK